MIIANPTKRGTGIELWGDYNDLNSLYETVSRLSFFDKNRNTGDRERNDRLLTIFPYELRHAYQGDRLKLNVDNGFEKENIYYGFRTDWITMLYTISALRYNAGIMTTEEIDQAYLLLLEYWTRIALNAYDPIGARQIELFINARIDITNKYVYLLHQHLIDIYFSQKPTLKRFRSIPNLLISINRGKEYEEFVVQIENYLKYHNCSISELENNNIRNVIW